MSDTAAGAAAALGLAEILAPILEHLCTKDLRDATLVNRAWSYFATQLRWRHTTSIRLARVPVARRAHFAAMVEARHGIGYPI